MVAEPEKLGSGSDPLLRQMIEAGRSDVPDHESVRRMLASAGVVGALAVVETAKASAGAGLAAAVSGSTISAVPAYAVVKWTVIGIFTGALASGAASIVVASWPAPAMASHASRVEHSGSESLASMRSVPKRPAVVAPAPLSHSSTGLPGVNVESQEEPVRAVMPSAEVAVAAPTPLTSRSIGWAALNVASQGGSVRMVPPSVEPRSANLGEEASLVDRARAALSSGDLATVLSLTEEHPSRFPRAQLADAVAYLRMEALQRGGRLEEARRVAARLLETGPRGVHAARAEALLRTGH